MKFIDLTHGYYTDMPSYPAKWYPRSTVHAVMTPETDPAGTRRTFTRLDIFAHNATHVDVPRHFFPEGKTLDQLPLDLFIGRACVADLSHKDALTPITGADLEQAVGKFWHSGDRLLIRTDYLHYHWGHEDFWEKPPYLTPSAAEWAVEHGATLVGLDCITDKPGDSSQPVHICLLGKGIPILEYITNLHLAKHPVGFLVALPTKVAGVEASPVRALLFENGQEF